MKFRFSFLVLLMAFGLFAQDQQKFWDDATNGNLAGVQAAIAAGVDINATTKYGGNALSYACNWGHIEIVRLLLEKGAMVNAKDKFYQGSPLTWALQSKHTDIAILLLEHGADEVGNALNTGIESADLNLIKAALASKQLNPDHMEAAIAQAKTKGDAAIIALLDSSPVKPLPVPSFDVPVDFLKSFVGKYYNPEQGFTMELSYNEGMFISFGGPNLALVVSGPTQLMYLDTPKLYFNLITDESGKPQMINAEQGGQVFQMLPGEAPAAEPTAPSTPAAPSAPAVSEAEPAIVRGPQVNWPSFRGPNASGIADGQGAPLKWDLTSGAGVKWKTPMPGIATASPVIWGDQVFIVTAVSGKNDNTLRTGLYGDVDSVQDDSVHSFRVYCLDRKTGAILWEKVAAEQVPEVKRHLKSTQANASPVTDGKHVIACFGSIGLLVCYDMKGAELWRTDTGVLDAGWFFDKAYQWGHSASPVIYKDRVILLADIQETPFIAAYGLADGKQIWKTARSGAPAWGSPSLYYGARDEIVTNGSTVRGYDPVSGKELWSLSPNSEVTVATPVIYKDRFYITAGYPPVRPVYVVVPGSNGDISLPKGEDHSDAVAWSKENGGTYIPTPIAYRDLFYTCANDGRLTVYKADTGEQVYRARLGDSRQSLTASPIASDGRLYFTTEEGTVFVIQAGPVYKELAVNTMNSTCMSSPALSDGVLVISTAGMVYGLGE